MDVTFTFEELLNIAWFVLWVQRWFKPFFNSWVEPICACSARSFGSTLRPASSFSLVLIGHCSKLQHTVATYLFVHWAFTGHCSKLQHTVATYLLLAYCVLTGHCSKLQHTRFACLQGTSHLTQVFPLLVTVVSHSIPDFLAHFHFQVDLPIRHGVVRRSYI